MKKDMKKIIFYSDRYLGLSFTSVVGKVAMKGECLCSGAFATGEAHRK